MQFRKQRALPELLSLRFRASAFTSLFRTDLAKLSNSLTFAELFQTPKVLFFFFFSFHSTQFHFITNIGELIYCLIKNKTAP